MIVLAFVEDILNAVSIKRFAAGTVKMSLVPRGRLPERILVGVMLLAVNPY